jgi:tyrosyl-tRNA synthetase
MFFMDTTTKVELVKEVGEEILTEEELRGLLETKSHPVAYDGFEPSGQVHIAQGLLRAINVNKMTKAGFKFKMWVADWHGWANNKMGGDLEKIQVTGKYLIEVWKATGMDLKNVEFLWANDVIGEPEYWKKVMQVARTNTLKRILRCSQIMGRSENESLQASQILYPCMQAADIFHLEADITQLGMDQRKVNVLAREVGPKLGFWKPVVVSHHMLMGLGEPPKGDKTVDRAIEMKMSKSNPDSAIFMTDSIEDVNRKVKKAYCPVKVVDENPVLEYCKYILFERLKSLEIERPDKFGGNLSIESYDELVKVYSKGDLHPMDLKKCVSEGINQLIDPVRDHFLKNKKAKELLDQVNGFKVTR